MKKYFFTIVTILLFVFSFSGSIFATSLRAITLIGINNLNYPYVGEAIDRDVTVDLLSRSTVDSVVWYKDNVKVTGDTFATEGTYECRVYITPDEGWYIPTNVVVSANVARQNEDTAFGQDKNGYFCQLTYHVVKKPDGFPKKIRFTDMVKPTVNNKLPYNMISEFPEYYNYTKIEWYRDGKLLPDSIKASNGEYVCRVYIELYNGFELTSGIVAVINASNSEQIIRDYNGTYFEVKYWVGDNRDEKEITRMDFIFNSLPSYGKNVNSISLNKVRTSKYYEIGTIEWYHNDYRMLDQYFYEGTYKCRVYLDLINGGYFAPNVEIYFSHTPAKKTLGLYNNRYYIEETFNIKKVDLAQFNFDGLNIPVYAGVQDTKVNSLEPGLYTPSMVYWYKDGKYMSNIERFSEGTYKCKFSLTLNSELEIPTKLNATINGEKANIYMENNKLTIDKTYEIKKPTKTWTKASAWAEKELEDALNNALIPQVLNNKDYTQNITRAEFAAVAVKMYEQISMKSATPVIQNPFTDTNDVEILKAYALGITNGTSATTFQPNSLITRQEMATMMVRALDKADVSVSVNLNTVKKFADHAKIDSWALNGVYFMSNVGIIKGKGNNTFDVLGNATREEALAISIRSVNKYR